MRKPKRLTPLVFKPTDRPRLQHALRQATHARDYRRLQAILWRAEGRPVQEIARLSHCTRACVYQWLQRYGQAHRPEDLCERPRTGRPLAAPRITNARIEAALRQDPRRLGYQSTGWTVPLLGHYLSRRYRCSMSDRTLRRRLKRLDWRWKRPRYVYSQKDPHRAQKKGPLLAA